MDSTGLITRILWVLPLALQATIAFAILKRKLYVSYPLFFSYTLAVLSREIVLMFLRYPGKPYALVYWYGEMPTILLAIGAILETVRHLFPPYAFLRVVLKVLWMLGACAGLVGILMLVLAQVGKAGDWVFVMIMLAERSVRFVEACWLILVIAFVSRLGRSWQQYSIGIVAGFGVQSAMTLASFELRGHLQLISNPTFVMLNSLAYNAAAFIWAFYFLRPRENPSSGRLPKANLSEWNNAVSEYYTQQWSRRY